MEPEIKTENLSLSDNIKQYLQQITKCAKFLSVAGFFLCGLFLLGSLMLLSAGNKNEGMVLLIMLPVMLLPTFHLYAFAQKTDNALYGNNQQEFEEGMGKLKSFFSFIYYAVIVYYILIIVSLVVSFFN